MKRQEIIRELDELARVLGAPLTQAETVNGWTLDSQKATLAVIARARHAIGQGKAWADTAIGRGLDHWGVEGGPMFDQAYRVFNRLGDIED